MPALFSHYNRPQILGTGQGWEEGEEYKHLTFLVKTTLDLISLGFHKKKPG